MTARTRLGLTSDEVGARARALEAHQDGIAAAGDDPDGEFVRDMLVDTQWDRWNKGGGHVVTPGRRDPFLRRMAEVEAEHLLEQVFPGRLPAAWSRLPYGDAIDRLIDQAGELDEEDVRRLADARLSFTSHRPSSSRLSAAWVERYVPDRGDANCEARVASAFAAGETALRNFPFSVTVPPRVRAVAVECATALVVGDLVGEHGLTDHDINTPLRPWITVVGDPREA